jgi:5-methylcytosine-specific restriction enzyme subunit McrC
MVQRKLIKFINLFEYSNYSTYPNDLDKLESFLDEIWSSREKSSLHYVEISDEERFDRELSSKQKFITILKNKQIIKSQKYIGIIKFNDQVINLLPKIFYGKNRDSYTDQEVKAVQANVLWWLSYCRKFKFPKTKSSLKSIKSNFFEILIFLYATYTKAVLNYLLYQTYEDMSNELPYMKGKLDTNTYIRENVSKGRWHKLCCTYSSFEFDNQINRIIKFVSKLLLGASDNFENKKLLSEIIFVLDDVKDVQISYFDCEKVRINPLFDDMFTILDYCKLFLSNSTTYSYKNDFRVFAFLLPMEYVFEDFIFGFIEKHRSDLNIKNLKYQKSDLYLAKAFRDEQLFGENVFNIRHDIYFEHYGKKIVCDTKYKIIYAPLENDELFDIRYGVSQGDLYQLASYAIRRKTKTLYLVYPGIIQENMKFHEDGSDFPSIKFQIKDEFSGELIEIRVLKVPIIHHDFPNIDNRVRLDANFNVTEKKLLNEFKTALEKSCES